VYLFLYLLQWAKISQGLSQQRWPYCHTCRFLLCFTADEFTGTIPEVYADMKQLLSIELHYNMLTGTVPDRYWYADNLQVLNLGSNFLSGTISTEVGRLNQTKGLFLFDNR